LSSMNSGKKGPGRPKKESNPYEKAPSKKNKNEDYDDEEDYGGDSGSDQSESMDKFEDDYGFEGGNGKSSKGSNKNKGRRDNSLNVLTRKFIDLIRKSPNQTVDLNNAVKILNVQKRRIYDITNVLEGIQYIEKVLKNKIKWVGKQVTEELDDKIKELEELEALQKEESDIDHWINYLQENLGDLTKDEVNNNYSYVTFDDVKSVNTLAREDDQPFLVIRAPKGTVLEVPVVENEAEEEFPHRMQLTSQDEEILIYVVSNDQNTAPGGEVTKLNR